MTYISPRIAIWGPFCSPLYTVYNNSRSRKELCTRMRGEEASLLFPSQLFPLSFGRFHRFLPFPCFAVGSPSLSLAESLCYCESFRARLRATDYRNQTVPVPVYRPLIIIIDSLDVTSSFRVDRDARHPLPLALSRIYGQADSTENLSFVHVHCPSILLACERHTCITELQTVS